MAQSDALVPVPSRNSIDQTPAGALVRSILSNLCIKIDISDDTVIKTVLEAVTQDIADNPTNDEEVGTVQTVLQRILKKRGTVAVSSSNVQNDVDEKSISFLSQSSTFQSSSSKALVPFSQLPSSSPCRSSTTEMKPVFAVPFPKRKKVIWETPLIDLTRDSPPQSHKRKESHPIIKKRKTMNKEDIVIDVPSDENRNNSADDQNQNVEVVALIRNGELKFVKNPEVKTVSANSEKSVKRMRADFNIWNEAMDMFKSSAPCIQNGLEQNDTAAPIKNQDATEPSPDNAISTKDNEKVINSKCSVRLRRLMIPANTIRNCRTPKIIALTENFDSPFRQTCEFMDNVVCYGIAVKIEKDDIGTANATSN